MDYIKEDNLLGNKKIIVGDKLHDLVLENLGRIYIRYGNGYKEFNELIKTLSNTTEKIQSGNQKVINIETNGLKDVSEYKEGSFVFNKQTNTLYIVFNNQLLTLAEFSSNNISDFVKKSGDEMSGPLTINYNGSPLIIKSSNLVHKLNSQFLSGYQHDDFAKLKKNEIISGFWKFENKIDFNYVNINNNLKVLGNSTFDGNLSSSSFISGALGNGWKLDSETNTLEIDNLIVRGVLNVYELVVNKIRATNGSLWITDSFEIDKIQEIEEIKCDESSYKFDNKYYILYTEEENRNVKNIDLNTGICASFKEANPFEENERQYITYDKVTKINNYNELNNKSLIEIYKENSQDSKYLFNKLELFIESNFDIILQDDITKGNLNNYIKHINLYYKYFGNGKYYYMSSESESDILFQPGDIIKCQKFYNGNIHQYHALILNIVDSGYFIQLENKNFTAYSNFIYKEGGELENTSITEQINELITPKKGDVIVRIGNIFNPDRQNSILLSSSDVNSPYEDILVGVNRPDYGVIYHTPVYNNLGEVIKTELKPIVQTRLGNLSGIYNEKFKNKQPKGYGLYGSNVYLTGEFYLNNGKSLADFSDSITLAVGNLNTKVDGIINNDVGLQVDSYLNSNYGSALQLLSDEENRTALAALTSGNAGLFVWNDGDESGINLNADKIRFTNIGYDTPQLLISNGKLNTSLIDAQSIQAGEVFVGKNEVGKTFLQITKNQSENDPEYHSTNALPGMYICNLTNVVNQIANNDNTYDSYNKLNILSKFSANINYDPLNELYNIKSYNLTNSIINTNNLIINIGFNINQTINSSDQLILSNCSIPAHSFKIIEIIFDNQSFDEHINQNFNYYQNNSLQTCLPTQNGEQKLTCDGAISIKLNNKYYNIIQTSVTETKNANNGTCISPNINDVNFGNNLQQDIDYQSRLKLIEDLGNNRYKVTNYTNSNYEFSIVFRQTLNYTCSSVNNSFSIKDISATIEKCHIKIFNEEFKNYFFGNGLILGYNYNNYFKLLQTPINIENTNEGYYSDFKILSNNYGLSIKNGRSFNVVDGIEIRRPIRLLSGKISYYSPDELYRLRGWTKFNNPNTIISGNQNEIYYYVKSTSLGKTQYSSKINYIVESDIYLVNHSDNTECIIIFGDSWKSILNNINDIYSNIMFHITPIYNNDQCIYANIISINNESRNIYKQIDFLNYETIQLSNNPTVKIKLFNSNGTPTTGNFYIDMDYCI